MKKWLIDTYLPMWAKQTVLADNRRLTAENLQLRQQLQRQQAYIRGLLAGIKSNRRGGEKK